MKVIHITNSYPLQEKKGQDIYTISHNFSDYKKFFNFIKMNNYTIVHIHSVYKEHFFIYALLARVAGCKVVLTLHAPIIFSYAYIVKQLLTRFLYNHIICTSKHVLNQVNHYHLASKTKRSLVYQGVNDRKIEEELSKDEARTYIYKRLGVAFTKNIRIVGTIADSDAGNGVEHIIDAAHLADVYKNLTNTIFVVLARKNIHADLHAQIQEIGAEGIFFIIEDVLNPENYLKAFDVYVSPRTTPGDLYTLLEVLDAHIPRIATKVDDTIEFGEYVEAPLVPPGSAKFLTEALMFVIKHQKPVVFKAGIKSSTLPKKFTKEYEKIVIGDIYMKVLKKSQSIKVR